MEKLIEIISESIKQYVDDPRLKEYLTILYIREKITFLTLKERCTISVRKEKDTIVVIIDVRPLDNEKVSISHELHIKEDSILESKITIQNGEGNIIEGCINNGTLTGTYTSNNHKSDIGFYIEELFINAIAHEIVINLRDDLTLYAGNLSSNAYEFHGSVVKTLIDTICINKCSYIRRLLGKNIPTFKYRDINLVLNFSSYCAFILDGIYLNIDEQASHTVLSENKEPSNRLLYHNYVFDESGDLKEASYNLDCYARNDKSYQNIISIIEYLEANGEVDKTLPIRITTDTNGMLEELEIDFNNIKYGYPIVKVVGGTLLKKLELTSKFLNIVKELVSNDLFDIDSVKIAYQEYHRDLDILLKLDKPQVLGKK